MGEPDEAPLTADEIVLSDQFGVEGIVDDLRDGRHGVGYKFIRRI